MATTREVLEFIIKADGTSASKTFNNVSDSASTAGKKLESGFGSSLSKVGNFIGNNLPTLAAGAAVAIGAFAAKSVGDFAKVALAAGKLADASGLSTQEAGRWIEVAGDIGIGSDTITSAFGKMNKAIATSPEHFAQLGITATDTNGRILQAIDAINGTVDPAAKAKLAADLFGKGWQQAAELIAQGSSKIKTELASVSDVKAVSTEDVSQARAYRAAMDQLGDSISEVGLTLGRDLIPGVAKAAAGLAKLLQSGPVKGALDIIGAGFEALGEAVGNAGDAMAGFPEPATIDGMKQLGDVLSTLKDKMNTGDALGTGQIRDFLAANKDTGAARQALEEYIQTAVGVRDGANQAAKAEALWKAEQEKLGKVTDETTKAADEQAASVEKLGQKLADLSMEYDAAAGRAKAWVTASAAVGPLAGIQRVADLNDALASLTDGFKKNGKAITETTEKGRANLDNLQQVQGAIGNLIEAQLKNGASLDDAGRAAGGYRDQLDGVLKKAGLTKAQIADYNKTLGLTPDQITTTVKLAGQEEARLKIQALNIDLQNLPKDVATNIRQNIIKGDYTTALNQIQQYYNQHSLTVRVNSAPGTYYNPSAVHAPGAGQAAGGTIHGYAPGGMVSALVGERGMERVILPVGSHVIPNHKLNQAGGGDTYNIYMPPGSDGADVVVALERWKNRNGASRLQRLIGV